MSLSAGTLNLKFMQRAAAKAAAANPASPATPAAASPAKPGTATPTPASAPGTPQVATTPVTEDEGMWSLPRRSAPASAAAGPSRPRVQVSFVSSYLPFMEDAPAMSLGGGRRAFGGFGEKEPEPEPEADSDEEAIDAIMMGSDGERDEVVKTRKSKDGWSGKGKESGKDEETPHAFQRPAGFEHSTVAKPASTQLKTSQAVKMRQAIAGMKTVSVTPSPAGSGASTPMSGASKKRAHPEDSDDLPERTKSAKKQQHKPAKDPKKMSLDEREAAIKAAKKAQKKKSKAGM